ncbi:class I SAM-dependent methyltransferase [Nocardia spumae]|uniref:class I SAM-dependent methyltransferase n=1 Tax=Nocardia spumae TaxID=2887190 RepID=UPI001D15737D|nr:methyltransferase domain-containing protein [Nocardia spumae]
MAPIIELDSPTPGAIDGRHIRAISFQEVRLTYVVSTLRRLGIDPAGCSALVIGSGRGLLARGLAGLGCRVVALDPSAEATGLAREAARGEAVEYATASAEQPGRYGETFDIVYCADTFEITDDLDGVLAQVSRLLRPDGVLCYDTVNRTPISRLVYLVAFQSLPFTRIMPRGRYTAARLRTPGEVAATLTAHGLRGDNICSFKPGKIRDLVRAVRARRRGTITDPEIPALTGFVLEPEGKPVVTYLGCARHREAP